jgi:hypothetical protein
MRRRPGIEDTIRISPRPPRHWGGGLLASVILAVLLAGAVAGWLWWPRPVHPPAVAPLPVSAPAAIPIETASEEQIRDHVPTSLTVFRFAANPRILVLDFASLREQGMMLNRVAALVEKADQPHDRVLTDSELDRAIRAQGDTVETFYYGHDYSAAALARFFALADRDHVELHPEEAKLRALLQQEGWFSAGVSGGLISIPAVGADAKVTAGVRAAILHHELSHGEFFSNPAYADYVHRFWLTELTDAERDGVRRFLAKDAYDPSLEEVMYNEMQAYLMFTREPVFFTPAMAGLTPERLEQLQAKFLSGMPPGWLRDVLAGYATYRKD